MSLTLKLYESFACCEKIVQANIKVTELRSALQRRRASQVPNNRFRKYRFDREREIGRSRCFFQFLSFQFALMKNRHPPRECISYLRSNKVYVFEDSTNSVVRAQYRSNVILTSTRSSKHKKGKVQASYRILFARNVDIITRYLFSV
jgi:hypothetical protein